MPALGASEDARERAYGAGIHVLFSLRVKDVDGRNKSGHDILLVRLALRVGQEHVPIKLHRHARAWRGHPRLSVLGQDVDGRNKSGHDGLRPSIRERENRLAGGILDLG
jgi:hypothetical protein